MTLTRSDREQIERDIVQCGSVDRLLDQIASEYAHPPASKVTDEGRPSGLVGAKGPHEGGVDTTPLVAAKLFKDAEYQRLRKLQKAKRMLLARLNLSQRRVVEVYYWHGQDEKAACALIGIAPRTLRHYREQIVWAALEEFRRAGIETYQGVEVGEKGKSPVP